MAEAKPLQDDSPNPLQDNPVDIETSLNGGSAASSWSAGFVSACETGDLRTVSTICAAHGTEPRPDYAIRRAFQRGFEAAILNSKLPVADHLIDHGVANLDGCLTKIMRMPEAKDREHILQRFLDSGRWKINEPLRHHMSGYLINVLDDERMVRWFLARGADPNLSGTYLARTPMFFAAQKADVNVLKALHEHGGKLDNLLFEAAHSDTPGRREVIEYLLAHGADVSAAKPAHPPTWNYACVPALGTPLHSAIGANKEDLVVLFLQHGASLDRLNNVGQTPLELALARGYNHLAALLEPDARYSGLYTAERLKFLISLGYD